MAPPLEPATILLVSVIDKTGADVRARVSVTDSSGHEVNGMISYNEIVSSMQGGFSSTEQRVGPLPPGRYTVTAIADDGRRSKRPVNLSGQPERRLKVRLKD